MRPYDEALLNYCKDNPKATKKQLIAFKAGWDAYLATDSPFKRVCKVGNNYPDCPIWKNNKDGCFGCNHYTIKSPLNK